MLPRRLATRPGLARRKRHLVAASAKGTRRAAPVDASRRRDLELVKAAGARLVPLEAREAEGPAAARQQDVEEAPLRRRLHEGLAADPITVPVLPALLQELDERPATGPLRQAVAAAQAALQARPEGLEGLASEV